MSAVKWHKGPMAAFDTETTSPDPHTAHIVTAAVVHHEPGSRPQTLSWLIDPGVDVPDEAAAIHGWTTERLRTELAGAEALYRSPVGVTPMTRAEALESIAAQVVGAVAAAIPVVIMNAAFDLTITDAECRRARVRGIDGWPINGIVDPMVLDKQHDPYRKSCYKAPGCDPAEKHHECGGCRGGKVRCGGCGATDRTLTGLCAHYDVLHAGAHDAGADAVAAMRIARKVAAAWPDVARLKLDTLHRNQVGWRADQMRDLASFFRKIGEQEKAASCNPQWPIMRAPAAVAGAR